MANRRNIKMEREQQNHMAGLFDAPEPQDNVIDFLGTGRDVCTSDPIPSDGYAGPNNFAGVTLNWSDVADILDFHTKSWDHAIQSVQAIDGSVIVRVAITIDSTTREGLGIGNCSSQSQIRYAEEAASIQAALKFDIVRKVGNLGPVDSDKKEKEALTVSNSPLNHFDPIAKTIGELVTPRQLGIIRSLGRNFDISTETECQRMMKCSTNELSKYAASELIDYLQRIEKQTRSGTDIKARRAG